MPFSEEAPKKVEVPGWVTGRTWARLPISALFAGELSYSQLRVLVAVTTCLQEGTDWTTVSAAQLGAMLKMTRQGVNKHLKTMEELGYIRMEHRACVTGYDDRRRLHVLYSPFEFENAPSQDFPERPAPKVVQFGDYQMPETATVGEIEDGTVAKPDLPGGDEVAPGATPIEDCTHKGISTSDEKRGTVQPVAPTEGADDADAADAATFEGEGRWSRPSSLRYRGALKSWFETEAPGLSGHKVVADFKRHWEGRPYPEGTPVFDMFKGYVRNAIARSAPIEERIDQDGVITTAAKMIPPSDGDLGNLIAGTSERKALVLQIIRRLARTAGRDQWDAYFSKSTFDLSGKILVIEAKNRIALERIVDRFAIKIGAILADELGKGWSCFVSNDGVQQKIAPRTKRGS